MRRYSLTALSIWPFSTNFLAASMTFSLLKATALGNLWVRFITPTCLHAGHRSTAVCPAHLAKGTALPEGRSRKSTRESRALPEWIPHIGSPVGGVAGPLSG